MATGFVLSILAGIMLGSFAAPMKKVKVWDWEHTWLAFSLFGLVVMPFLVALATIPSVFSVWKETPPATLLAVMGLTALWGVAAIGYGLAVKLTGIAIANAVVLGLNNAVGAIAPIAVFSPEKLLSAAGLGVTAGVLVMILGIGLAARAGYLRDKSRRPGGPGDSRAAADIKKGLIIGLIAGVLGAAINFALISGKPIEAHAVARGASPSSAPNATWPVGLLAGCLVAVVYCVSLMVRRKNGRAYLAAGTGVNWLYAVAMAVLWYGGVVIYGNAVTRLGELGASVGWAVLQSMTVVTGAALGFATGEWKGAGPRIVGRLVAGLILLVAGIVIVIAAGAGGRSFEFEAPGMTVSVDRGGAISRIEWAGQDLMREVKAFTRIRDCQTDGRVEIVRDGDAVAFRRTWTSPSAGRSCQVTDRFSPGSGSVRWDVEIAGLRGTWTTPIETWLVYPPGAAAKFWTAWGDPRLGAIVTPEPSGSWSDPLVPVPFADETIWYGALPYAYDDPRIGFIPFQGNLFGIPLVTISEDAIDRGLSLILSPEDTILDLSLRTRASGEMVFSRDHHRISPAHPIRFRMDLVGHESGWRGGLRWMTVAHPGFFDPNVLSAHDIAGTGAYSSLEKPFDLEKMRGMAFGVNWKASFDFPYMGMFIPPVESETARWQRYGGDTTSIKAMSDYATGMMKLGFHVLSYFNVTEFGAHITDPAPPRKTVRDEDLWTRADDFLYGRLADAILAVPAAVPRDKLSLYRKSRPGGPYYTWGDGIILDPGEPVYQAFLLDQAAKHIRLIPDAAGICIDRMDWLRMYNEERDDGVSWFGGRPARSLRLSWKGLLDRLGPMMHRAGKAIFVNNHDKRIDLLRETDGFFDEFTYGGSPLNLTALLGVRRPVLGWTAEEKNLRPDPDAFFQRYLHLGVFPMAPFPGNDHSLLPGDWVDRQYLDYGPLLRTLKGKTWVLEPHCVEAAGGAAKVNLFEVPDGWVVPVTFGPEEGTVTVVLRNVPGMADGLKAEALHPGGLSVESVPLEMAGSELRLRVGTRRGCAVVRIVRPPAAGPAGPETASLDRLFALREKVADIHPIFAKLYPVAVAKDKGLRIYIPDEAARTYVLSKTAPEPFPIPIGIRAAFPLEALGGETACVVTPEVFTQPDGLVLIFHEFVHCAQWASVEAKLKETLGLYRKAREKKDFMWELGHPFPYEDPRFVAAYAALLNALDAGDAASVGKGRDELANRLSADDFDYMTWQEWKEGLSRHLENAIRARLGLPANDGGLETPYTRVTFYAGGDRLIGWLAKSDPAIPADLEKTFLAIRNGRRPLDASKASAPAIPVTPGPQIQAPPPPPPPPAVKVPPIKVKGAERMIDVGGRRLHSVVYGSGGPTVVLVSGFQAPQSYWNPVVDGIAGLATVVTYDRAGYGQSERGDRPVHGQQSAADLRVLLDQLDVPRPYLLVGHSYGGRVVRLFASAYPGDTAGLLLEEAGHEDLPDAQLAALDGKDRETLASMIAPFRKTTPDPRTETDFMAETVEQLRQSGPLPRVPLVVITAASRGSGLPEVFSPASQAKLTEAAMAMQKKLVELIPGGEHILVEGAGHNVHLDRPEAVIGPIRAMIARVKERGGRRKPVLNRSCASRMTLRADAVSSQPSTAVCWRSSGMATSSGRRPSSGT